MNTAAPSFADTLLISANFFGYAGAIQRELEARGRSVLWFEDRPGIDTLTKLLVRVRPELLAARTERYLEQIIAAARAQPIRDVLVIKGEAFTPSMLNKLRRACPKARFTLYFWDSYRNMPRDTHAKVACFDRALSFDPEDSATDPRLRYRPLFFLDQFRRLPARPSDIDLLFLGTVHTDRFRVLRRLARTLPAGTRFELVLFYPSRPLFHVRRLADPRLWGAQARDFSFTPIPAADVLSLIARARVAVDIERPVQAGFTMRTIEMLGASKKLLTTNARVLQADFYRASNVAVLDRRAPRVDESFLAAPYQPLPPALLERYSLAGWLDDVLPHCALPASHALNGASAGTAQSSARP